MSSNLQFRNMLSFEHDSIGLKIQTIAFSQNVDTPYQQVFYNDTVGPAVKDSIIIGSTDSRATTSATPIGLNIAWDRGLLVKNVQFMMLLL